VENTEHHTESLHHTDIQILTQQGSQRVGQVTVTHGRVRVTETFYAYHLKAYDQVLATKPLDLPPYEFDTTAAWLTMPPGLAARIRAAGHDYAGGLHAAEHALIHMMPLLAMCDRGDVGGMSTTRHRASQTGIIFLYDGFRGGLGITHKAAEQIEQLATITRDLVESCHCTDGCPSCVYDRNCGNDNQPMDRRAATTILALLLPDTDKSR
jgi:DEAD/DEAH box helicase domain-containing protein